MSINILWRPAARRDFKTLYLELGRVNQPAAERYASEIQQKILRLAEHPRMGPRRREIFPTARMLVVAPFVILYQIEPDLDEGDVQIIEIVRILDGRRDLPGLF